MICEVRVPRSGMMRFPKARARLDPDFALFWGLSGRDQGGRGPCLRAAPEAPGCPSGDQWVAAPRAKRTMALLRVLLLASLPCLGLTQEERLLIVYPAAPNPQNTLLPQSNEIEDSYTKVSSIKQATKKPVMRTKSTSSVSTTYSVSSSVSSSESSRRIDIGEDKRVKERVVMGRVGKVNRERMRDFYSRRRGEARKLMIIPPTRCS